jgi:hypothetical protein
MTSYRDLLNHAAAKVNNSASTGQAAYSGMALEIMMSGIVCPPLQPPHPPSLLPSPTPYHPPLQNTNKENPR